MKILYATSEAAPYIKSGGLGDVAGALPQALTAIKGNEVTVVLPYYASIKNNPNFNIEYVTCFYMPLAWRSVYVGVFKTTVKSKGVGKNKRADITYYFIDNEQYFNRGSAPYGYADDGERFAFFSKAVLEFLNHIDYTPEIIHCNDWQTGYIPLLLKSLYKNSERHKHIRTVYTIHNIEYQGKADMDFLPKVLGIDKRWENVSTFDNLFNAMKSAIVLSDKVTTVSATYAHELKYAYFAHGLENILRENEYKTFGIVNGIDTNLYNPETDITIPENFKASDLSGKAKCKEELQKMLRLPVNPDVPIVAMVSRLVDHKGLELVDAVANQMLDLGIQFVVLGTGDKKYENMFKFLDYTRHDRMSANITFNASLANQIYAGSDFFLMPSKSEPCGLSQLIAMRYGTIPIVRETGGLYDTVPAVNTETLEGRGFTFKTFNAFDMLGAVQRAVEFYYDKDKLNKFKAKIMHYDSSWKTPAVLYNGIYKELLQIY